MSPLSLPVLYHHRSIRAACGYVPIYNEPVRRLPCYERHSADGLVILALCGFKDNSGCRMCHPAYTGFLRPVTRPQNQRFSVSDITMYSNITATSERRPSSTISTNDRARKM